MVKDDLWSISATAQNTKLYKLINLLYVHNNKTFYICVKRMCLKVKA